jgi:chromosome partitioning protein
MTKTIAVVQRKGGVGKTTIAAHLAAGLAARGETVVIIDTDPQGDAARVLDMQPEDGLFNWLTGDRKNTSALDFIHPVSPEVYSTMDSPSRGSLYLLPSSSRTFAIPMLVQSPMALSERIAAELAPHVNRIIIDSAPTLSMFDASVYMAGDAFLYVTECEALSASGLRDGLAQLAQYGNHRQAFGLGLPSGVLGIVPNKMRPGTRNHRANIAMMAEEHGGLVWKPISQRTLWSESQNMGRLIWAYAPGSVEANEADEVVNQAQEVLNVV